MTDRASETNSPPPLLVIEAGRRKAIDLGELWRFREVVACLLWRDFKVRYRQTLLGVAWAVLQPALTVVVFTMIFSRLANVPSQGVAYPLFALTGLVPWYFFSNGVGTATIGMIANQELVRRVYFPRVAIPFTNVLSGIPDLLIGLLLVVGALAVYDVELAPRCLVLPVFLLLGVAAALGVGMIVSAANVQYRDVGYAIPFALQIALFLSPIAYPSSVLPAGWRLLYSLNPMVGVVDGVRWCLVGTPLHPGYLALSVLATAGTLALGALYFRNVERGLADVL